MLDDSRYVGVWNGVDSFGNCMSMGLGVDTQALQHCARTGKSDVFQLYCWEFYPLIGFGCKYVQ
jgi:hypothetical protein